MGRAFALLFIPALTCPACAPPAGPGGGATAAPQRPTRQAAARLALDDYFSGVLHVEAVFVEAGPLVSPGLRRVGKYKAEVVSAAELSRRFAGRRAAPSLARVSAEEAERGGQRVYVVHVGYTALRTPGAESIPLGGGAEYTYKVVGGSLVLAGVSRVVE